MKKVKQVVLSIAKGKDLNITSLADRMGKSSKTLGATLIHGNPSVYYMKEIFEAMDEDLVLITKDGNKYKL